MRVRHSQDWIPFRIDTVCRLDTQSIIIRVGSICHAGSPVQGHYISLACLYDPNKTVGGERRKPYCPKRTILRNQEKASIRHLTVTRI